MTNSEKSLAKQSGGTALYRQKEVYKNLLLLLMVSRIQNYHKNTLTKSKIVSSRALYSTTGWAGVPCTEAVLKATSA